MWIYTVSSGDTAQSIAEKHGTTRREVVRLNELSNDEALVAGMHLLLPNQTKSALAVPYTVQTDDTFQSLSKKLGLTQDEFEVWLGIRQATGGKLPRGKTIYVPKVITTKRTIEVNGYLIPTGTATDSNILNDVPDQTYMSVFSYQAKADGSLVSPKDNLTISAARNLGIAPLMTLTNFDGNNFNTELAHTIMTTSSVKQRLFQNILTTLKSRGFRGVNVDFEHMNPDDRPLYNQFIRDMGKAVRAQGYSLSIAMGPKTSDMPEGTWMGAFDYKTLGTEVDFIMLMTYEWGWVGGPPMAVAPINQVKAVLDYATSIIDPAKILMGMSLYGYDWTLPYTKGSRASGLSNNTAQNLALTERANIQFDAASASPYFNYKTDKTQHVVWFDDALSAAAKLQLVNDYKLRGVSLWVLGNSFPQLWHLLKDTFEVEKL